MLTHSRKQDIGPGVQLNMVITPMLDMTFQLLFFFVLMFKPQELLEGKMDFNLPASGEARAQQQTVDLEKPSDIELALPAEITVEIQTQNSGTKENPVLGDGNITGINIKAGTGDGVAIRPPTIEALEEHLRKKRADLSMKNTDDIKIQAASKLKYMFVVQVMDACLRAGFQRVGFAAPPDLTVK